MKVQQELMRHASIQTTMNVWANSPEESHHVQRTVASKEQCSEDSCHSEDLIEASPLRIP
jgi:hypothetical protein